MKKTLTAFVAAAMLATVPLAASTHNAAAGSHKLWKNFGKGVATGVGVGVGLGVVGALTRPRQPQQVIVQQPAPVVVQPAPQRVYSQAHYAFCHGKYNSYHAPSNTFQPLNLNRPRQQCYSPY